MSSPPREPPLKLPIEDVRKRRRNVLAAHPEVKTKQINRYGLEVPFENWRNYKTGLGESVVLGNAESGYMFSEAANNVSAKQKHRNDHARYGLLRAEAEAKVRARATGSGYAAAPAGAAAGAAASGRKLEFGGTRRKVKKSRKTRKTK